MIDRDHRGFDHTLLVHVCAAGAAQIATTQLPPTSSIDAF
jgi:hypothetical protein